MSKNLISKGQGWNYQNLSKIKEWVFMLEKSASFLFPGFALPQTTQNPKLNSIY